MAILIELPPAVVVISLELPAQDMSPNGRVNWREKARLKKAYREQAFLAWRDARLRNSRLEMERDPLGLDGGTILESFFWPDEIERDPDNASASMKEARDAACMPRGRSNGAGLVANDKNLDVLPARMLLDRDRPRVEVALFAERVLYR